MKILIINGPNINMLGAREPQIYGTTTLDDINNELVEFSKTFSLDVELEFFQSNHEGDIVDKIQKANSVIFCAIWSPVLESPQGKFLSFSANAFSSFLFAASIISARSINVMV